MIVRSRTDIRKHRLAGKVSRGAEAAQRRGDVPTASLLEAWGRDLAPSPLEEHLRDWLTEGGGRIGIHAIEASGDRWVMPEKASLTDWLDGAHLSAGRLGRCRRGSRTWWRHRAVMLKAERRAGVRALDGRRAR